MNEAVEPVAVRGYERIYGIYGGSTRSLSPQIHNGAYQVHGLSATYLSIGGSDAPPLSALLDNALPQLAGLTVVSPHKELAIELADEVDPIARHCGGANLLVRRNDRWRAETTDAWGVIGPLRRRGISPAGRRAAVIGCGGAGRAAALALVEAGADVTLVNRHQRRGELAAELLDLPWVLLDSFSPHDCELIVNATPLGQAGEPPPFAIEAVPRGALIIDYVYAKDRPTPLAESARRAGLEIVDGREVLIVQVAAQYERMTGVALDESLCRQLAGWGTLRAEVTT